MADTQRKLQVSNGHYIEFDQLARLLHALDTRACARTSVLVRELEEETGLPFRQVRNRISIGRAMGLFELDRVALSPFGCLVAEHDPFFESIPTLEYCHCLAAGGYRNLVWYDTFNELLWELSAAAPAEWLAFFRRKYADEFSPSSTKKHMAEEVRFVIDAYTRKNLKRLELVVEKPGGVLQPRRYASPTPLILAAVIYDFAQREKRATWSVSELTEAAASPARLFRMDRATFRGNLERLHDGGYLRMETRHNLDQVRLLAEFSSRSFLAAHYEGLAPKPADADEDVLKQGRLL